MKALLLGATILSSVAFLSTAASAADAVVYEAPVVDAPTLNLSGFYAGLQVGYVWGDPSYSTPEGAIPEELISSGKGKSDDGGLGGVYAGYNWQLNDRWLVGVEGDANYLAGGKGDNWLGSARLRAGYLVQPETLVYATGGLAFGQISTGVGDYLELVSNGQVDLDDGVTAGWTLGVGAEHWFTDKVSMKLEYLYTDLGNVESASFEGDAIYDADWTSHTVRAGIALHF